MALFDTRKAQSAFYKAYPQASQFSDGFKQYVEACIRWNYWHLLLAYPILRGNTQTTQSSLMSLPSVMTEELANMKVNDEAVLPAEPYQNFLFFYVTYFNSKARNFAKYTPKDIQTSMTDKAAYARQHLTGKPYQYALARGAGRKLRESNALVGSGRVRHPQQYPNSAGYVTVVKAVVGR